jgi:hypothetical protein
VTLVRAVGDRSSDQPLAGVQSDFVDVAPTPILFRLERLQDRMSGSAEMGGGVLVFGAVTATYVTAHHAQPQVDPRIADTQAVFASIRAWRDRFDLIEVGAGHRPTSLRRSAR